MADRILKKTSLSLVVIDSHCVLRDGLARVLEAEDGFEIVGSFASPGEASKSLQFHQVDIIIMELLFADSDALRCIKDWSRDYPQVKVIVLSQFPEEVYAERVLAAGGAGYLMKEAPTDQLVEAVYNVQKGKVAISPAMSSRLLSNFSRWRTEQGSEGLSKLSDRELLVLTLIGQGHPTARIAETMGISKKTVSTFKERIKVKLSLTNSLQLSQIAMQQFGRSI